MSSSDENKKLNSILNTSSAKHRSSKKSAMAVGCDPRPAGTVPDILGEVLKTRCLEQWTSGDNKCFVPASKTAKKLPAAAYEIQHCPSMGIYFKRFPVKTEGVIRFPQTNAEKVVKEIEKFWDREHIFREYGLTHKRGIMLWGPPGGGKSCALQLVMKDVVQREGIVVKFTQPGLFIEGMRILREIEETTPVVVLMEDIDATLEQYSESEVLNILDGVDRVEKICFLATTNYPERLGARVINRPSRFDKRFYIDYPNPESREIYIRHLIGSRNAADLNINVKTWVKDTERFSLAHIKELFITVVILGDEYADAVETLASMKEIISSDQDREPMMGFKRAIKYSEEDYGDSGEGYKGIP